MSRFTGDALRDEPAMLEICMSIKRSSVTDNNVYALQYKICFTILEQLVMAGKQAGAQLQPG
jgi:hypothetical protein